MPQKAFCIFIFSNSLLFQSFIFLLLKPLVKALHWWKSIDRQTNCFGNIGRQIYLKCFFSHSKLVISVISKPNKTWNFRIKMFKMFIFCNHPISAMIRNELNYPTFFGTFSREKMLFQQVFHFEYLRAFFFSRKEHCHSIVLTDENPLLQSLFCCC